VDGLLDQKLAGAKGPISVRQSGRSIKFQRELEAMGLATDDEYAAGLYSFVRPKGT
jgi:hypothetical protein